MEDENGLELSLGLFCGGSSGKTKARDAGSDPKADGGASDKQTGGNVGPETSLKRFFQPGFEYQDRNIRPRSEIFFPDLGKSSTTQVDATIDTHSNSSQFARHGEPWVPRSRQIEVEEDKASFQGFVGKLWPEASKNKVSFEDVNQPKKHAWVGKGPHMSLTVEDGSSTENEVVAESEAGGSNSCFVSKHEDSDKMKNKHGIANMIGMDAQGARQSNISGNQPSHELQTFGYRISSSIQPVPSMPVNVPAAAGAFNSSGFPSPSMVQLMSPLNGEGGANQPVNVMNSPLAFGYPVGQLPTLETDSSFVSGSQSKSQLPAAHRGASDGLPSSQNPEDIPKISPAASLSQNPAAFEGKFLDLVKSSGKGHAIDEACTPSSSQAESEKKGSSSTSSRPKEMSNQPTIESLAQGGLTIRPGVAPNLKFGGCGSCPDLPWVSATGTGPNGKTISGVTYKFSENQIKIVCACHGTHMSPDEFFRHASADAPISDNNTGLGGSPAASAQS
ncbi:hypothetical protein QJS10_CPA06g00764 [Acorus calamus]|uniref:Ninja-family protein n=1 Tax=Acorus calamus TaxID=4465 RepID=A0AAV9EJZ0_ACOCL|nr:hypothetical protein QJS10_CPA06g00764 [Acorus calamus]